MRNTFYIVDLYLQPSSHSSQLLRPLYILSIYPPHRINEKSNFSQEKEVISYPILATNDYPLNLNCV